VDPGEAGRRGVWNKGKRPKDKGKKVNRPIGEEVKQGHSRCRGISLESSTGGNLKGAKALLHQGTKFPSRDWVAE